MRALLPRPTPDAHKYTRGVVGVRAGSEQYPGAGVLCVSGAGAGLVGMVRYVGEAADLVRARHPEVVVGEGRVQAWVIGSGGGASAEQALADSLADQVPVVVDADGLGHVDGPLGVPALLTPHAGELARMLDVEREEVEAEQLRFAREAAERYDAVVLLKGRHTLVAAPDGRVNAHHRRPGVAGHRRCRRRAGRALRLPDRRRAVTLRRRRRRLLAPRRRRCPRR